jgi:RNA polymerase sigma-70 factor, ECF subfamily
LNGFLKGFRKRILIVYGKSVQSNLLPHREAHLDPTSEKVLLIELQHGSQRAFAEVYQQFSEGVFAYCVKILADRQLAQDVVQETFLKVQQYAHTVQNDESFKSWVFRIARNEALMQLRKRRVNGELKDDSVWDEETPYQLTLATERTEIVNRMLDNLKHEYREVLVLLVYEGMSYAEIAHVTGTTESSVKSRIFRARKAMVERLKGYV